MEAAALQLPYREGTWFGVPLRSGGFAAGRVARSTKRGKVLLGYFFGPRRAAVPLLREVATARPAEAALVAMFGDLGLIEGTWPILGEGESWAREQWPMPDFVRVEPITGRMWRVRYDDKDPNKVIGEERLDAVDPSLATDTMSGAGAIEIKLDRLLE